MSSSMSHSVDPGRSPLLDGSPVARVLVVDDVEANRALVTALLTRDGHHVEAVATGDAALDSVRPDPPDLVLLDVMMPAPNGFDVCRVLKEDAATTLIPVVLTTALHHSEPRIPLLQPLADHLIPHPST